MNPPDQRRPNRLIHEDSPYLRQHAHNPVDWYPWGADAFAKARAENKPIFLSIGYSTCHWCHVMERESFENTNIAGVLNQFFVCIKVDREERPDLDTIYMAATQATTGSGGWPMSLWLTHDLKPFYCGTYLPPDARYGRPGFKELLQRIHEVWEANPSGVVAQANQLTEILAQSTTIPRAGDVTLDDAPLQLCFAQLRGSYDNEHGGFGDAPKFPRPVALNFLFQFAARTGNAEARAMALYTLRQMGAGGLFDQLGGGFHRYSVDERWLVSHFEKMLYDQAQLVSSCIDAYQITGDEFYADIARRTCDYVLRDMTSPTGGFYSAEDADSEGVEGKFYVWTHAEVEQTFGDRADAFCRAYDVTVAGNWEHGVNVLHGTGYASERAQLLAVRNHRIRPHRDEKIITAWNGLMISALCRTAQALDEPRYLTAAQHAARCRLQSGTLTRSGNVPAIVDDYAFFANALVDLYETDFDPTWVTQATALADGMLGQFYDVADGGFFLDNGHDPSVILRVKAAHDGAEPSGNSIATRLLLRLALLSGRSDYRQAAERTLTLFAPRLRATPHAMPELLCALDFALGQPKQIVIAGQPDAPDTRALLRIVRCRYLPNKVVMLADAQSLPREMLAGKATAYVCADFVCQSPTTEPAELAKLI